MPVLGSSSILACQNNPTGSDFLCLPHYNTLLQNGEANLKVGKFCFAMVGPHGKKNSDCYHANVNLESNHMDSMKMLRVVENIQEHKQPNMMLDSHHPLMTIAQMIPITKNTTFKLNYTLTNSQSKKMSGQFNVSFPTGVFFAPKLTGDTTLSKAFFKTVPAINQDYLSSLNGLVSNGCADLQSGNYHMKLTTGKSGVQSMLSNGKPLYQCGRTIEAKKQTADNHKAA